MNFLHIITALLLLGGLLSAMPDTARPANVQALVAAMQAQEAPPVCPPEADERVGPLALVILAIIAVVVCICLVLGLFAVVVAVVVCSVIAVLTVRWIRHSRGHAVAKVITPSGPDSGPDPSLGREAFSIVAVGTSLARTRR